MPVCRFKAVLGAGRFSAEQAVVAVEATIIALAMS